ncbi:hypothetical protein EBR66_05610 [bacterium]|nr:hypothetical protein [bacterium]
MSVDDSRGFIALTAVVIISAVLLLMLFMLGVSSFFVHFDTLAMENRRISLALSEACVNAAILRVSQNGSYAPVSGGDCVSLGGTCGGSNLQYVCKICSVTYAAGTATVITRARYNGAYTNLQVSFTTGSNVAVGAWSELPLSPHGCTVP